MSSKIIDVPLTNVSDCSVYSVTHYCMMNHAVGDCQHQLTSHGPENYIAQQTQPVCFITDCNVFSITLHLCICCETTRQIINEQNIFSVPKKP